MILVAYVPRIRAPHTPPIPNAKQGSSTPRGARETAGPGLDSEARDSAKRPPFAPVTCRLFPARNKAHLIPCEARDPEKAPGLRGPQQAGFACWGDFQPGETHHPKDKGLKPRLAAIDKCKATGYSRTR
jgi:hypothetical protein